MISRMDGSIYVSQSNFCIHRQYSHGCYPKWMFLSIQFLRTQKIYQSIKPGRQSCLDPDDTVDGHMNKNQVKTFSIALSIHVRGYNILKQYVHMSGWVGLQKGKLPDWKDWRSCLQASFLLLPHPKHIFKMHPYQISSPCLCPERWRHWAKSRFEGHLRRRMSFQLPIVEVKALFVVCPSIDSCSVLRCPFFCQVI